MDPNFPFSGLNAGQTRSEFTQHRVAMETGYSRDITEMDGYSVAMDMHTSQSIAMETRSHDYVLSWLTMVDGVPSFHAVSSFYD